MSSIKNVAIIMDGNGRWAKERRRPRVWGHVRGSNRISEIVETAASMGLESLTLYAFSTENWSRPTDEITNLFKLLKKFLVREKKNLITNNIRFDVIGNYKVLDSRIVEIIEDIKEETMNNTGLNLSLAINYGGRAEIVDSVNKFLKNSSTKEISENDISENLYNNQVRDIDLLVRTAGDKRISNFLMWQVSYAELYFTETKWPDFSANEFKTIVESVTARERRFGGLGNSSSINKSNISKNQKVLS